jgi:hypothetical protein
MNVVHSVDLGTRRIMGTDWPVSNEVERLSRGKRRWLVIFELCNGIPASAQAFATKREAVAAAEEHRR